MTNLRVETVAIANLISDPDNARKHSKKNIDSIVGSLKKFGQRKPIVATAGNIVIAGNGTLQAAKEIGWTEIVVAYTPTDWTFEQARAYALADNRTAELGDWDSDKLAMQLIELDSVGWELADIGFPKLDPSVGDMRQDSTHEINVGDWTFEHKCPKCGFEFNDVK